MDFRIAPHLAAHYTCVPVGPLLLGAVSAGTGNQRWAGASLAVFFIADGFVLAFVRVPRDRPSDSLRNLVHSPDFVIHKSLITKNGWVAEWSNAPDLKSGKGASPSWVRIPPHPPS